MMREPCAGDASEQWMRRVIAGTCDLDAGDAGSASDASDARRL